MKIMNGPRVYVENIDVAFFVHSADLIPKPIIAELTEMSPYFVVPNENGMAFERYFKWPVNTSWLMEQDWLEDYDLMSAVATENLERYRSMCLLKRNQMVAWYNEQDDEGQIQMYDEMMAIIGREDHRLLTLQAYIETRNDEKLVISLPKELKRRVYN